MAFTPSTWQIRNHGLNFGFYRGHLRALPLKSLSKPTSNACPNSPILSSGTCSMMTAPGSSDSKIHGKTTYSNYRLC